MLICSTLPLYIPEAFPAVTDPDLSNAGLNLFNPSTVQPDLGNSSIETSFAPVIHGEMYLCIFIIAIA